MEQLKLNLGAGAIQIEGYTPVDIKNGSLAYPLEYGNDTVDEIRASHILEHYSHRKTLHILKHWVSKLKPGGLIKIAVPDFAKIAKQYLNGKDRLTEGYTVGGHIDRNDKHEAIFDRKKLIDLMKQAGLVGIKGWKSEIKDCASLSISLNLQGTKPAVKTNGVKVQAVMSLPRLAFTDNMFNAFAAMLKNKVNYCHGCGVFWGQVLTRLMEEHLHDGTDFIFTVDYDTWFTWRHVKKLLQLMRNNPDIDAIIPVQIKRGEDYPLIGIKGPEGAKEVDVPLTEFMKPLTPVITGHFGLTLFRVTALRKLQKPWFMPQPDEKNTWGANRIDEDIYFWNNFIAQGFKACLANEVRIGHIQTVCVFPDEPMKKFRPIYVHMNNLDRGEIPAGCEPVID